MLKCFGKHDYTYALFDSFILKPYLCPKCIDKITLFFAMYAHGIPLRLLSDFLDKSSNPYYFYATHSLALKMHVIVFPYTASIVRFYNQCNEQKSDKDILSFLHKIF